MVSFTPAEIDELGVHRANLRALSYCLTHLPIQPDLALIDGFRIEHAVPTEQIIEGDRKSYTIGCASILAKVTRDRFMRQLSRLDERYNFAAHKGYGTAAHRAALETHGVTVWHRRSFAPIKALLYN
jgi:ribonuclease HII